MNPAVEVLGLGKEFIRRGSDEPSRAVDDVSFAVEPGSFFTLLGPSGCGKTTTLRCLAGLESADHGEISMNGETVFSREARRNVSPEARPIAMVPQSYGIWPHMTVFDNAAFPLRHGRKRHSRGESRPRVMSMLEQVGLQDYATRWATQLSGGQQQRLALARALLCEPEVLLLDEPLSNLDAKLRGQLRHELRDFQQQFGVTSIYVTHDQAEALAMSDVIVVMNLGRIEQIGAPAEIYDTPASRFVADFVGSANLIPGEALGSMTGKAMDVQTAIGTIRCERTGDPAPGDVDNREICVCVRPEHVEVLLATSDASGVNHFKGRVASAEYLGDRQELVVDVGDIAIRAQTRAHLAARPGDDVVVAFDPAWTISLRR